MIRPALALLLAAGSVANATWSIVLVDRRTGEVGVASATCLTGFDLRADTPVVLTGIGAATAQSFLDTTGLNRAAIRDGLARGDSPQTILARLATIDSGHQTRQYGMVSIDPFPPLTFSGTGAGAWAGGRTGQIGDLYYAVQGNVLTGAPVVNAAVTALETTAGDMPAKLMAAMQAARAMGGDGRCSCAPEAPTACGSPPASFTLSANIAYFIIARAGDRDAANGLYSAPNGIAALAVSSTAATLPSVGTVSSGGVAGYYRNITGASPRSPFGLFQGTNPAVSGLNTPRGIAVADLNADGRDDLLVTGGTPALASVWVALATPTGYAAPVPYPTAPGCGPIFMGDLNRDGRPDVVVTNQPSGFATFLNNGDGTLAPLDAYTHAGAQGFRSHTLGDFNADGWLDAAFTDTTSNSVRIFLNRADGTGRLETVIPFPLLLLATPPTTLAAGDVAGDSRIDLVVGSSAAPHVQILQPIGTNGWSLSTIPVPTFTTNATVVRTADMNRDGRADIIAAANNRIAVFFGAQFPTIDRTYGYSGPFQPFTVGDVRPGDLDGDGYPDLAVSSSSLLLIVENQGAAGPGRLTDSAGFAAGDYFINHNIAGASATDPDPVGRIQTLFDAQRAALVGQPDAIRSSVALGSPCLGAGSSSLLIVRLADWGGATTDVAANLVHVEAPPGVTAGPAERLAPGEYAVPISAGVGLAGQTVRARVRVNAVRPVILMPDLLIEVRPTADLTGDGAVDFNDYLEFLNLFNANDPRADLNADGAIDFNDYLEFLNRFNAGC